MYLDPGETVSVNGSEPLTLWNAVTKVMSMPRNERVFATISRKGHPTFIEGNQIEKLAAEWGIGPA
jgi:hypothetical protein